MKKDYEIILRDIFGGDGEKRYIEVEESKLSRKKTTTKTKSDLGIPIESGMNEVLTETKKVEVHTFRRDGNDFPLLRLGGMHGKFWGALREARSILYALGDARFRSMKLIDMVQVQPVWVTLEPLEEIRTEEISQILNAPGKPMIIQQFDVIPKCKCEISLIFPDSMEELLTELLKQIKMLALFNKRRATIEEMKER